MRVVRLSVLALAALVALAATVALVAGALPAEDASRAWVASLVAGLLAADVDLRRGGGGSAVLLAVVRGGAVLGAAEVAHALAELARMGV